ncbi:hypothetical protein IV203_035165 [Nitzschia inconspicua]|uniref:Uncharacterized protein n=1 Tax=Nitzschia inconspicua TaxID=303405 RepID=A0A9K3LFQ9_9STRA|nr:hypothetical protein IV203_035165 [Nitzschia inconspicua]
MVTRTRDLKSTIRRKCHDVQIPALVSTESETVSTLGMQDVATSPNDRASIYKSYQRRPSFHPVVSSPSPRFVVTQQASNMTKHKTALVTPSPESRDERIARIKGPDSVPREYPRHHHPRPSTVSRISQSRRIDALVEENTRERERRKLTKRKKKKKFTRNPNLEAALYRNQQRRQQQEGTSARLQTSTDQAIRRVPNCLHVPPNGTGDNFEERMHQRQKTQQRHPRRQRVAQEPRQVNELRDVVDIFSEYESILDRLVYKHAKLQSYIEADNLPRDFVSTKHAVRERLHELRRQSIDDIRKNRSQSVPNTRIMKDERQWTLAPASRTPNSRTGYLEESNQILEYNHLTRSKSANSALQLHRETQIAGNLQTRRPESLGRPKYGRNEGFIHSHDSKQVTSEAALSFPTGRHKNSHLLYRNDDQKEAANNSIECNTMGTSTKRAITPEKVHKYEKARRIEQLREELAHLREKRKTTPTPLMKPQYLEDHLRAMKNPSTKTMATSGQSSVDPLPTRPIGYFCSPASPSSPDPAGEHYNPLTIATKIQPEDRQIPGRLDAPGPTIQDMEAVPRVLRFSSSTCIQRQNAPPDCEPTSVRFDEPSSRSLELQTSPHEEDTQEDSIVVEIHKTLSQDRQRIEELEKRVMESKHNKLDVELQNEILKISPLLFETNLAFTNKKSLSTSSDDEDSSGSDYGTDSSVEVEKRNSSKVHIRSSIRPGAQNVFDCRFNSGSLSRSSKGITEQKRRDEFLERLRRKRNNSKSHSLNRLSDLLPESSYTHEFQRPDQVQLEASSLSSKEWESDEEPQGHFLPVSSANRGQWQPYVTVKPENQIEAILSSFSNTAKHFLSNIDIANTFSREIQAEQHLGRSDPEGLQDAKRVSFDTLNERARRRQQFDFEDYSDNGSIEYDDYDLIHVVEAENGMIHVDGEDPIEMQLESFCEEEMDYEDDRHDLGRNHNSANDAWARAGDHLRQHQKHFLEPAPSYKDPQEYISTESMLPQKDPWENISFDNNKLERSVDSDFDTTCDDESVVHDHKGGRYVVFEQHDVMKNMELEDDRYNIPNDALDSINELRPTTPAPEDPPSQLPPPRSLLRQMPSNLLSSDSSSRSSTSDGYSKMELQKLVNDLDDISDDNGPGQRRDRYNPVQGGSLTTKTIGLPEIASESANVARPPQIKRQSDPPTSHVAEGVILHHDHPQEDKVMTVVVSPRGAAIESTKNRRSWQNPFNFWG